MRKGKMSNKEAVLEKLDQAHLYIMDVKDLMDDNRHFHMAGELIAVSEIVSGIIREAQHDY